jgi:hypothetical protein
VSIATNATPIEQATKRGRKPAGTSRNMARPILNLRIEAVLLPEMTPQFDFLAWIVKATRYRHQLDPGRTLQHN